MVSYGHDIEGEVRTKDVQIEENVNFTSMLLPDFVLKGLHRVGFKRPSPIQLTAVPLGRCGFDLIVQAKSGTGKTLVFTLMALETLDMNIKRTQVLITAPTREIAVQIADVVETVGHFLKGLKVGILIGGVRMESSLNELAKYQVIVGAPGRIRHLIEKQIFDARAVRLFVLDEADKLMEDTFVKDINYIFHNAAESKQVVACSATYTPRLVDFVKNYMRRGLHVTPSGGTSPILIGLKQYVYITADHCNTYTREMKKQEVLFRLLSTVQFDQCLVFTNYVVRAESLCGILQKQGWRAICLTSKQTQENRLEAMSKMKEHKARILVTTDLAARGIDAAAVNLVINVGVPLSPETYLHRIGRAGRFGNKGLCVTLVSKGEETKNFQRLIGTIGDGDMAVNVIPSSKNVDLWNDEEFDILKGIFEEVEETCSDKIETLVGDEGELKVDDDLEEGEIVDDDDDDLNEDDGGNVKKDFSGKESTSSGIDVSSNISPRSGEGSENTDTVAKVFPAQKRDWKSKYLDDGEPIEDFTVRNVDAVTRDLSNLDIDDKPSNAPQRTYHGYSTSPWRHGHENLWRNGHPQSFFPLAHNHGYFNGFRHDHGPCFPMDPHSNFYNEPTLRYNPHARQHFNGHGPLSRQNYWMHHLSSQIDNYIQYARRFHS